ncbi:FG-nucleoporin nsp1 [Coemansia sp. RSA 552]|nr:FG-nucleoporin nsp1 [Coemansia sp. RSA 552]
MFGSGSGGGGFSFGQSSFSSAGGASKPSGTGGISAFSGFGAPSTTSGAAETSKPAPSFGGFGGFGTQNASSTATEASKPASSGFGGFGGFGASSTAGETSKPSSGFSFTTATSKPEESKPAVSFGGFGGFGAAASKPEASKPATGFGGFGTAASTPTTTAASSSGFGGFKAAGGSGFGGFGSTPSAATPTPAAATTAATGGFGMFGAKSSASASEAKADAPVTTAADAAANPTAGTGFGGFKLSTAPAVSASSVTATPTKTGGKEPERVAPTLTTSAAAAGGGEKPAEKATDLANTALRGKTLEEIAQMWTTELTTQTRAFHTQASTVAYWDRALVQQGKRITELYEATMAVEGEQAALDQSLEHMEGQQASLLSLLDTYEGRVQDIVHKTTSQAPSKRGVAMSADQERDHVYSSAERLNQQLDELARRLTTLVEDVNSISAGSGGDSDQQQQQQKGTADPFGQIVQILNAHLTSMEWIDSQTAQLQDRLKTAQRVYQDVVGTQSAIAGGSGADGSYGTGYDNPPAVPQQQSREGMLSIPGAFVNDPPPPVTSSLATPLNAARSRIGAATTLSRPSAATASPFAHTPLRRGL